jgi:hypothetical protein
MKKIIIGLEDIKMNTEYLHTLSFKEYGFFSFFITLIYSLLIDPIIFHFFVIPKIEKRVGEKLPYLNPLYNMQIFAKWFMPPLDIALSIVTNYCIYKLNGKKPGKMWGYNLKSYCALQHIKYDITQASRIEIFFSFLSAINMLNFCLIIIIGFIK